MPSRSNRRVPPGRKASGRAGARRRKPPAGARAKRPRRAGKANRRVDPTAASSGASRRAPLTPEERKTRNRTLLVIAVLALVNVWVFGVRRQGLDELQMPTAIGAPTQRKGFADPIEDACGGDPVRIFEGLERQLFLRTRLSRGRTLRLGLLELGVPGPQIDELEAAVRAQVDLGILAGSGAPMRVSTDRDGLVSALEIELAEGHLVQACRSGDGLQVRNIQHPLKTDVQVVGLVLPRNGDLVEAVTEAGEAPALAREIAEMLAYDVDFMFESRPGDELQLIVEKRFLGSNFHRYGPILAARYKGAAGYFAYYYYHPTGGEGGYYDGYGEPMRRALRRSPVAFHPVDPEERGGLAPIVERVDGRDGALFRRAEGAPVVALGDGRVVRVETREEGGLVVEIEHDDEVLVTYMHLMRTLGDLRAGDEVRAGQLIALVGHTGQARTDQLRMEIRQGGELLQPLGDPMTPLAGGDRRPPRIGSSIPKEVQTQFETDIDAWRQAMRNAAR